MESPAGVQLVKSSLSISNVNKKILDGPQFLDQLVSSKSLQDIALEHQHATETRSRVLYKDLLNYATSLSTQLRRELRCRETSNHIIPVIIPQCAELYISYLAILHSGSAFCPVSPDTPAERLKFIVGDVGASMVLVLPDDVEYIRQILPDICCRSISLNDLQSRDNTGSNTFNRIRKRRTCDDIAYVMYTSGSTGLPKGVKVSHWAASQSLLAHNEHIPAFKRFLQFAAPTFDVSVFEIFFTLFRGSTLVSCDRERLLADLPGEITNLDVDGAELTPTVASTLLRSRSAAPSLRILLTIGEMLNRHVVEEFGGSDTKDSMLYAMYGPTEAAIHCTIAPKLSAFSSVRSIGVPLSTVTALILSPAADSEAPKILDFGEEGELAVAGQLALGYLNRPEQTAAAFINLPDYGAVYRTGDRALMMNDGQLQIIGRMSSGQVKLRGQRIELGEIEEVAMKAQGVDIAIAAIIDDTIVLFCFTRSNITMRTVRRTCESWLPRFMRPGDIVVSNSDVPRLPSGKVDRKSIESQYYQSDTSSSDDLESFENDVEQDVAMIVSQELDTDIGPTTSLWAHGLDSLKAIRLAPKLRPIIPSITVPQLLECDTARQVISQINQNSHSTSNSESIQHLVEYQPIWETISQRVRDNMQIQEDLARIEKIMPCSPMQVAMLSETIADARLNFNTYKLNSTLEFKSKDIFKAFNIVAERNELLRSGFAATENAAMPFVQIVWKKADLDSDLGLLHPLRLKFDIQDSKCTTTVQIHHAMYDGWSWELVLQDLNSALSGHNLAQRVSYQEFSKIQRSLIAHHAADDLQFWIEYLEDFSPSIIPILSPNHPEMCIRRTNVITSTLSTSRLSAVAKEIHVSRQAFVQAAFALLLGAYCDSSDVTFGIVSSGRELPLSGIEHIIGPCLSTLPFRVDLSLLRTGRDLISHVQRLQLNCLKHSRVTLGDIKRQTNHSSGNPLFDSLVVWQETLNEGGSTEMLKVQEAHDALPYSLVLEAEPSGDDMKLILTSDGNRVAEAHNLIILAQIDKLMQILVNHTDLALQHLWSEMDEAMLSLANSQFRSLTLGDTHLTSTIEKLAQTDSERIALRFVDDFDPTTRNTSTTSLSYKELYQRSGRIASALFSTFGIKPNDLVGIVLPKSVDLYLCVCATIMSGAGYMCIDPRTPSERLDQILQQAQCKLVVVSPTFYEAHSPRAAHHMVTFSEVENSEPDHSFNFGSCNNPEDLAYTVFTSGSTGTPKGVEVNRGNLLTNILHLSSVYPHNPHTDCLLQSCSASFDVSVFEIFWTWHCGMTLCAATNDVLFRDMSGFINAYDVTHLSLTPSVAALIDPNDVPKVKFLVTAGEPMNTKVFRNWAGRGLWQGYGPSETTNICNVQPEVSSKTVINNVGPAFPNTSIFVCARQVCMPDFSEGLQLQNFQPLPRGSAGEIWIGGEQVGRGYTDSNVTSKHWLTHPRFGRLYRSGDIGRLLCDGSLLVLGREDDQIKLRGQRIELGDINATLTKNPLVKDAFTAVIKGKNSTDSLVSFWLSTIESSAVSHDHVEGLFRHMEDFLPPYMVPECLLPVAELPLTRQGKIDKPNLVKQYESIDTDTKDCFTRAHGQESGETLSGKQLEIARVLAEVSNVPLNTIHPNTSFFSLGIDSITAVAFASKLREQGLGAWDVSDILRSPSIRRLTSAQTRSRDDGFERHETIDEIFDNKWKTSISRDFAARELEVSRILPCTPLQEIMLASSDESCSKSYLNHLKFELYIPESKMRKGWTEMVRRHNLLRTTFIRTDLNEMPYAQVVLNRFRLPWLTLDDHELAKAPNAFEAPPYAFYIEKIAQNHKVLHLLIHHALYDAEAMSVLLEEVQYACKGETLSEPVRFDNYLSYMLDVNNTKSEEFWQDHLNNVQPCRLNDFIHGSIKGKANCQQTVCFPSRTPLAHTIELVKKSNTTLLSSTQAALAQLLKTYTGSTDICFGTVLSGRNLPLRSVERMVAPTFNTLPIRIEMRNRSSNQDICDFYKSVNNEMLPFQPTSPRKLQKKFSPDGRPLFDVLLLLQSSRATLDNKIWRILEDSGEMNFPFILELEIETASDTLILKLHHQLENDILPHHLLEDFDNLLSNTLRYPQALSLGEEHLKSKPPRLLLPARGTRGECKGSTFTQAQNATPLSVMEEKVARVLLEVSKSSKTHVTSYTTIFQVDIDSIGAVRAASHLRKAGYNVRSTDLMEALTIGNIAKLCGSVTGGIHDGANQACDLRSYENRYLHDILEHLRIDRRTVDAIWPCTSTQSGILVQAVRSKGRYYCNSIILDLGVSVDINQLKEAWLQVMQLHPMLRTGFAEVDDRSHPFAMIVYSANQCALPWIETGNQNLPTSTRRKAIINQLHQPCWQLNHDVESNRLELTLLHSIYDAASLKQILDHVKALYRGQHLAQLAPIEPALAQIIAQNKLSDESQNFWESTRDTAQPTQFPNLRVDKTSTEIMSTLSFTASFTAAEISKASERFDVFPQVFFQAAWAHILALYTAQDCVTFGIILSGREFEDADLNEVAFPCLNTVPCSVQVSKDIQALMLNIAERNTSIVKHQFTPLPLIKRWLGTDVELFDTILVLQQEVLEEDDDPIWKTVDDQATAEYVISLEVLPYADGSFKFLLTYSEAVLPPQHAKLLLEQFDAVVLQTLRIREPSEFELPTSLLSLVPAKIDCIPSEVEFLHEFVERSASKFPSHVALEFVTSITRDTVVKQEFTYSELEVKANKVANLLLSKGAKSGDLVAICFNKCPEASFATIGILKAGCGYVAVDPGAPRSRQQFILEDAQCRLILTSSDLAEQLQSTRNTQVISLNHAAELDACSAHQPVLKNTLKPNDTCYCLYTSGTTGTPKGCLISHESAVQAMLAFTEIFEGRWTSASRWLQFASFHFDVSVLEQFWSWSVGTIVISVPRDLLFEDVPGVISTLGITHLDLTPSLAKMLTPQTVPSLCNGVFIVGGEQVQQEVLDLWGDTGCLFNFYGPSEVTIGCTVNRQVTKVAKTTNIGQPWINVGAYVLEPDSEVLVPKGAIGELCLSGPLVGKGYLKRPQLSATKFRTLQHTGIRIYRTGDLVRLLHDDSFEFLGRSDDQIKLRGQRLEVGEINHAILRSSKMLKEVSTLVLKHHKLEKEQLVSFVSQYSKQMAIDCQPNFVQSTDHTEVSHEILKDASQSLPSYMVPSHVLFVDFIPLTANNKVDNKKLKALYESSVSNGNAAVNVTKRAMSEIEHYTEAVEVLETFFDISPGHIDVSSRLFELGLDSITAITLARKLRKVGYTQIDAATLMSVPDVKQLLLSLDDINSDTIANEQKATEEARQDISDFCHKHQAVFCTELNCGSKDIAAMGPCTPLQEAMISRVTNADASDQPYFVLFQYRLRKNVDIAHLINTWQKVQQTVDVLKTYFILTEDGYGQAVLQDVELPLVVDESSGRNIDDIQALTQSEFNQWIASSRHFGDALPWALRIAQDATSNTKLMSIFMFHGLYDGISIKLLTNLIEDTYLTHGTSQIERPQFHAVLPHGPLNMNNHSKDFWRRELRRVQLLDLPLQTHEKEYATPSVIAQYQIDNGTLGKLCNQLNVTIPALFHAAWLLALYSTFKVNPTIGIVVSGRSISLEDAEQVIGPMFNTLPCSIDINSGRCDVEALIQACHAFAVRTLPYQHTSLGQIRKSVKDVLGGRELFDSLFVFQKTQTASRSSPLWTELESESTPDYPLNIEIEERKEDRFVITIVAKSSHLSQNDIDLLLNAINNQLDSFECDIHTSIPIAFQSQYQKPGPNHHSQRLLNGTSGCSSSLHKWDATSTLIRSQISILADVSEDSIGLEGPTIFELGLDSIDALKLGARLKSNGMTISVSKIMANPTVAGITGLINNKNEHQPQNSVSSANHVQEDWKSILQNQKVEYDDLELILPVTSMQEGLLFDYEKYFNVHLYQLHKKVDFKKLQCAIKATIYATPLLRTGFVTVEEHSGSVNYLQLIHGAGARETQQVHVKTLDSMNDFKLHVLKMCQSPPPLNALPIFTLAKVKDYGNFLVFGIPHALYDGWAMSLIHQRIKHSYLNPGKRIEPDPAVLIERYIYTVQEQIEDEETTKFWNTKLKNCPSTIFPAESSSGSATFQTRNSSISRRVVQEACRRNNVTIQTMGLACWALTIAYYTKQLDVAFGVVLSGRVSSETENMVFPTFNTVIFRNQIQPDTSVYSFLQHIQSNIVQILDHQHYPLRKALKPAGRAECDTFNTLFTYQKDPNDGDRQTDIYETFSFEDVQPNPPYSVNVELTEKGEQLMWTIGAQQDVVTMSLLEQLFQIMDTVLHHLSGSSDDPVVKESNGLTTICESCEFEIVQNNSNVPSPHINGISTPDTDDWSSIELKVRDTFAVVSQTAKKDIGRNTSMLELGLDSINAIKISNFLRKENLPLAVSAIIKAKSVTGIAKAILDTKNENEFDNPAATQSNATQADLLDLLKDYITSLGLFKTDIELIKSATAGQTFMLDSWHASSGRLFYPCFWLRVDRCSQTEFERAIDFVAESIPALRTTFIQTHQGTYQVVIRPQPSRLSMLPWNLQFVQNGSTIFAALRIHHALYDAVSLDLIVQSLAKACGKSPCTFHVNTDASSFEKLIQSSASSDVSDGHKFWQSYLSSAERDTSSLMRGTYSSARTEKFIPALYEMKNIQKLLRKHQVSAQALFFTLYAQIHASLRVRTHNKSLPKSIIIGLYLANRSLDLEDLDKLAAPTFNIVPLVVKVCNTGEGLQSLVRIAQKVQEDIHRISDPQSCGASMRDIYSWTSIQLDAYMNFLRLPDREETSGIPPLENNKFGGNVGRDCPASITRVEGKDRDKAQKLLGSKVDAWEPPTPIHGDSLETAAEWCIPAIDVEAKLDDQGTLAMGIFAPEDMLNQDAAEGIMQQMRTLLEQVAELE